MGPHFCCMKTYFNPQQNSRFHNLIESLTCLIKSELQTQSRGWKMEQETSGFNLHSRGSVGKAGVIPPNCFLCESTTKLFCNHVVTFLPLLSLARNLQQCCNTFRVNKKSVSLPYAFFFFLICWNLGRNAIFMRFLFCVVVINISLRLHSNAFRPDVYS